MSIDAKFFPTEPKKIRERIKRYERSFKDRQHDDGAGKRFLLGQLYMLMGDTEGALNSYAWYQKRFPDDSVEPFNHLCWTLALLKSGSEIAATTKLRELVFENLYIVPILLGEAPTNHGFRHFGNWSESTYVTEGPMNELFVLWSDAEREWLKKQWVAPGLKNDILKYIELQKRLNETSGAEARGLLINEAARIARGQNHLKVVGVE